MVVHGIILGSVRVRYRPPGHDVDAEVDRLNRTVLDAVQQEGDVLLTGTDLRGRFVLRVCIVNFRSTDDDVNRLVEVIRRTGKRVAAQRSTGP